jgi:hypothetical protein
LFNGLKESLPPFRILTGPVDAARRADVPDIRSVHTLPITSAKRHLVALIGPGA